MCVHRTRRQDPWDRKALTLAPLLTESSRRKPRALLADGGSGMSPTGSGHRACRCGYATWPMQEGARTEARIARSNDNDHSAVSSLRKPNDQGRKETTPMKKFMIAAALAVLANNAALAANAACETQATDKKLSGAAKTSFLKKC